MRYKFEIHGDADRFSWSLMNANGQTVERSECSGQTLSAVAFEVADALGAYNIHGEHELPAGFTMFITCDHVDPSPAARRWGYELYQHGEMIKEDFGIESRHACRILAIDFADDTLEQNRELPVTKTEQDRPLTYDDLQSQQPTIEHAVA